jgi:hypothetical protein
VPHLQPGFWRRSVDIEAAKAFQGRSLVAGAPVELLRQLGLVIDDHGYAVFDAGDEDVEQALV